MSANIQYFYIANFAIVAAMHRFEIHIPKLRTKKNVSTNFIHQSLERV